MKYIERNPKIMGGCWVIKGTRIPLTHINALYNKGYYAKDVIKNVYPNLAKLQLIQAIAEYWSVFRDRRKRQCLKKSE